MDQALFNLISRSFVDFSDFGHEQRDDRLMCRERQLSAPVMAKLQNLGVFLLCKEDSVRPPRNFPLIIVVRARLILVSGFEKQLPFLTELKQLIFHPKFEQLIITHQLPKIFAFNEFVDFILAKGKFEVEITEKEPHVVFFNVIILVLGAAFGFEAQFLNVLELLESLGLLSNAVVKVAVDEAEARVFEIES